MTMTNPAFRRNPAFKDKQNMSAEELQKLYELTSDNTVAERPMTFESTLMKSVLGFAVLLIGGVIGAQIGGKFGTHLRGEQTRALLALMVVGVALKLAIDLVIPPNDAFSLGFIVR
jgi:hypothetical protein